MSSTNNFSLAIVGSGISGMGAAWQLQSDFRLTIFEAEDRLGGHTHTHYIENDNNLAVDTGFIVFNHETYPNLIELFKELDIKEINSDMSFSVESRLPDLNWDWAGSGLNQIFARRRNLFSPRYYRFLRDILRFNKEARQDLATGDIRGSIGEYIRSKNLGDDFLTAYLVPMGSAVWSTPLAKMEDFPARAFLVFFRNHGFLGVNTHFQWKTLMGGTFTYTQKIRDKLSVGGQHQFKTGEPVKMVRRLEDGRVGIETRKQSYMFDAVLLATHGDTTRQILTNQTSTEQRVLATVNYQPNQAILHTDESIMPRKRRIWSSWNYKIRLREKEWKTSTVYWMNRLQNLDTKRHYFVSINEIDEIQPDKIIRVLNYEHPLFTEDLTTAQTRLTDLNADGPVFFSGAWWRFGFHEDGYWSALQAVKSIQEWARKKK